MSPAARLFGVVCRLPFAAVGLFAGRRARGGGVVAGVAAASVALVVVASAFGSRGAVAVIGGPTSGTTGGLFNSPGGAAVNESGAGGVSAGTVYVADSSNNRVEVFNPDASFAAAWGADVDGGTSFETCTAAASCKAGVTSVTTGGAMNHPTAVAVDPSDGSVYVVDQGNRRIEKFTATGAFVWAAGWDVVSSGPDDSANGTFETCVAANGDVCKAGAVAGANAGQFAASTGGIAVNPTDGQVIVADSTNRRLQMFSPDGSFVRAVGYDVVPAGQPGDTGVQLESCPASAAQTAGACQAGQTTNGGSNPGQFSSGQPTRVATDSGGFIYTVESSGNNRVQRFSPDGSSPATFAASTLSGTPAPAQIAVDQSDDHVFVVRQSTTQFSSEERILEFDGGGNLVETDGVGAGITAVTGLAVDQTSGKLYLPTTTGSEVVVLGTVVPPTAGIDPVTTFGASTATFTGTLDPTGFTTGWHFEYVDEADFQATGFANAVKAPATDTTLGFTDSSDHAVSQDVTGLLPDTLYHVRLVATKPLGGGTATSSATTFTTTGAAPQVADAAGDEIQNTSARLVGYVNPNGQATTYHFEYGTAGDCATSPCTSAPAPGAPAGSGQQLVFESQSISGLSASTTYHYRLVATNTSGTTDGPDQTFTTRATALPADNRAYELVTPADKPGGTGVGGLSGGGDSVANPGSASQDGDRYISSSFAGVLDSGSAIFETDYAFSQRESDQVGWVSHSPYTHPNYSSFGGINTSLNPDSCSADLSVCGFNDSSGGAPFLFPEMASWPGPTYNGYVSNWSGQWELQAPTDESVGRSDVTQFASADGSHVAFETSTLGQLGATDPSLNQTAGLALYDDNISAGISDQFTPDGVRSLVGVCTGSGADRTQIPDVDVSGDITSQTCPDPPAGFSQALISLGGADIAGTDSGATQNAISNDGQRIFFNSPDSTAAVANNPTSCSGSGATTKCPTQLFVSQSGASGNRTTRWISKPQVPGQAASLLGKAVYEGASTTGSKVFFATDSPLTADDPNGTGAAPVTTGSASNSSWDLYEYDVPSGSDGQPGDNDPGAGSLTRVSAGPTGTGDCNTNIISLQKPVGGLRFASDDGTRLYFVCAQPLPGVPTNSAPTDGTTTTAGLSGSLTSPSVMNLYYYDSSKPLADRWEFIAQLPTGATAFDQCSTETSVQNGGINIVGSNSQHSPPNNNCFRGTTDGSFVTFMTSGSLLANDTTPNSVDIYAFNTNSDRLIRIDAPQGGTGALYPCAGGFTSPTAYCQADEGFSPTPRASTLLNVAADPTTPGDRMVFFESKSQLVSGDTNDAYDTYEWRNGKLSLISTGTGTEGAYYAGNSADGRDVFFQTRDQLTWQDIDGVEDIYDARVGGGIPEPAPGTPACAVLGGVCQGAARAPSSLPSAASVTFTGPGDTAAKATVTTTAKVMVKRKTISGTGFTVMVKVPGVGRVTGSGSSVKRVARRVAHAGTYELTFHLTAKAMRTLKRKHSLRVKARVAYAPAAGAGSSATVSMTLHQPRRPAAHRARRASHHRGGTR